MLFMAPAGVALDSVGLAIFWMRETGCSRFGLLRWEEGRLRVYKFRVWRDEAGSVAWSDAVEHERFLESE